jgi:hypothetical protein
MGRLSLLIALLASPFLAVSASAEKQAFACQYTAAAGLNWESGVWKSTGFTPPPPFILVMEGDVLTKESVANAVGSQHSDGFTCQNDVFVSCTDDAGLHFVFNSGALRGGVSRLFGTLVVSKTPDTPYVAAFTCAEF